MKTVSAREANQTFSRLLAEVAVGEEIIITRRGRPVVKSSPPGPDAADRKREQAAARMMRRMRKGVRLGALRVRRNEMHER